MEQIKIKDKKLYRVMDILGFEPVVKKEYIWCNPLDFQDGLSNLEIHIDCPGLFSTDQEVKTALEEIGMVDRDLLERLKGYIPVPKDEIL